MTLQHSPTTALYHVQIPKYSQKASAWGGGGRELALKNSGGNLCSRSVASRKKNLRARYGLPEAGCGGPLRALCAEFGLRLSARMLQVREGVGRKAGNETRNDQKIKPLPMVSLRGPLGLFLHSLLSSSQKTWVGISNHIGMI